MRLRLRKDSKLKKNNRYNWPIKRDTDDGRYTIRNCDENFMINNGKHCNYCIKDKQKDRQAHSSGVDDAIRGYLRSSSSWRDHTNGDDSFGDDIELDYSTFLKNLRQNNNSDSDDENSSQISTKYRNTIEVVKIDKVKNSTNTTDKVKIKPAKDLRDVNISGKISHDSKGFLNRCEQSFLDFGEKESKKMKYSKEVEKSSSDIEIIVMGDAPVCSEGNFTPFECKNKEYIDISETEAENTVYRGCSQFREEVINIYKKPYDQDEYDELLEAVKSRKPIKGRKNYSKSLLDHNGDFKAELDRFSFDRPKMLNILRGFFYWLQNLSHEGTFKPWRDPLCQAIEPIVYKIPRNSSANVKVKGTLYLEL